MVSGFFSFILWLRVGNPRNEIFLQVLLLLYRCYVYNLFFFFSQNKLFVHKFIKFLWFFFKAWSNTKWRLDLASESRLEWRILQVFRILESFCTNLHCWCLPELEDGFYDSEIVQISERHFAKQDYCKFLQFIKKFVEFFANFLSQKGECIKLCAFCGLGTSKFGYLNQREENWRNFDYFTIVIFIW